MTVEQPEDAASAGNHPAAPQSQLASLRARREKAAQKLWIDLPVPRYDPPVYVRFKPVQQAQIDAANKAIAASTSKDRILVANANVLSWACLGVYVIQDGREVSPVDGGDELPRFDQELAAALGNPTAKTTVEVMRGVLNEQNEREGGLYLTDGDVVATADAVHGFSGFRTEQYERDIEGN
jgi:hypothetical protein